jgi:hypothetical protein
MSAEKSSAGFGEDEEFRSEESGDRISAAEDSDF